MVWNRENVRSLLLVICGGVMFYGILTNLSAVLGAVGTLLGIVSPFLLGGVIAFILNVPMRAIERHLFPRVKGKETLRRPLALLITLLAVIGILTLASCVIGPGIADAVRSIAIQIPSAANRVQHWVEKLESYWPQMQTLLVDLKIDWPSVSRKAIDLAHSWGSSLLSSGGGLVGGVVSGVGTFAIGMVFSFYLLMQKEKLSTQGRQILYALLPEHAADRTLDVLRLSNRIFSSFLSGQCLEACILGTLFVISMTIFRMPYALLVGVLIALTALIPIVGAFIGCGVGALLIAVTDPWKAVWFVLLFLALQQIEGNLIYPHVVGSSVGLPSIWVLAAVTLGGKLMGIGGMLLFIPLCSVIYSLIRGAVKTQLKRKGIPQEKWMEHPPDRRQTTPPVPTNPPSKPANPTKPTNPK